MKKIKIYSAQYKIIQSHKNDLNPQSFTPSFANKNAEGESWRASHKKILSKDRQEFKNNIAASGSKKFNL